MTRWLNSLLLLVALASGVFAGTPLKSGEKECAMSKQMKCCKRNAVGQANHKEKYMAKLCGTLFCEHSGTTASTVQIPQFSTLVVAVLYLHTLKFSRASTTKISKSDSFRFSSSRENTSLFIKHHAFRI
jgi:hypothetical protein